MKKSVTIGAFLLFVFITSVFFWPLLKRISTQTVTEIDALNLTWNLNTVIKNFPAWPEKLMEGNIYYPYRYSAAYTDPLLTDSLFALPITKLLNEPLVAFNFNLILGQILFVFFTFIFLFELSANLFLALMLSLIFSFSPLRLHYFYVGHLNMFTLYWLPLAGFFLLRLAKTNKPVFIYLFSLAFTLQTFNSFLAGYFIIFFAFGLFLIKKELFLVFKKKWHHFLIAGLLSGVLLFPLLQLYFKISRLYGFSRSIRDAIHFSLSPEEVFGLNFLSPALFVVFLVSLIIFFLKKKKRGEEFAFLAMTFFFLFIAFGPALHWQKETVKVNFLGNNFPVPLPYTVFYYFLPGFKGFRTPSRWIFPFGFSAMAFSALIIGNSLQKMNGKKRNLFYLSVILLFAVDFKIPGRYFGFSKKADYPAVYHWLKNQPDGAILEIPIFYWGDGEDGKYESAQMIYGLYHQKKTVGGYSSFTPKEWEDLIVLLKKELPSDEALAKLKKINVDYLVIHLNEAKDFWGNDFQKKINQVDLNKDLMKVYGEDKALVYKFKNLK